MYSHLNVLPKQAKFDFKCFKRLGELTTLPQAP